MRPPRPRSVAAVAHALVVVAAAVMLVACGHTQPDAAQGTHPGPSSAPTPESPSDPVPEETPAPSATPSTPPKRAPRPSAHPSPGVPRRLECCLGRLPKFDPAPAPVPSNVDAGDSSPVW